VWTVLVHLMPIGAQQVISDFWTEEVM
jgi:hypothetical protein